MCDFIFELFIRVLWCVIKFDDLWEIMVDEGEKDMFIVEYNVLEVYEVKDGVL